MFINSKSALEFCSADKKKHKIPAGFLGNVPDWVTETRLYKAACKDSTITFVGESKTAKAAVKGKKEPEGKNGSPAN